MPLFLVWDPEELTIDGADSIDAPTASAAAQRYAEQNVLGTPDEQVYRDVRKLHVLDGDRLAIFASTLEVTYHATVEPVAIPRAEKDRSA